MKKKYLDALMKMAENFADTSEAKRLKVGAIIYKNDNIISLGVNGTPAGWHTNICEDENNQTLPIVRHAEVAALNKLRKSNETSQDSIMICTHLPCLNCAIEIVDSGIKAVYYKNLYRSLDGLNYLKSKGVEVIQCD